MKVRRVRPDEAKGPCQDCHNRAVIVIEFGHRLEVRLCGRDGKYLIEWVGRRLDEHEQGLPIPEPRARDDESRGNR